jgi:hypothetical protein
MVQFGLHHKGKGLQVPGEKCNCGIGTNVPRQKMHSKHVGLQAEMRYRACQFCLTLWRRQKVARMKLDSKTSRFLRVRLLFASRQRTDI